jgi:hypothetical protein
MMNVAAELTLFPVGAREGLPAVAVDITGEGDLPALADLLGPVARCARPGVSLLWLRTMPWGSHAVDKRIHEFIFGLPHMQAIATADAKTERWSNLATISWVVDITALVVEPTTTAALGNATIERAALYLPSVAEIIVREVHSANLVPGVLAALANMWSCDNGTIYVRSVQVPAATQAVAVAGVFAARVRA